MYIEHLEVVSVDQGTLHYHQDVLRDMRPTYLSVGMEGFETELGAVSSSEILSVPLDTYPTHLDCDIHIYGFEGGKQIKAQ